MSPQIVQILAAAAGILSIVLYIGSYLALQLGRIRGQSIAYAAWNGAAALLLLVSLIDGFNPFVAAVEVIWIAISLVGILRILRARKGIGLRNEEREFLARRLPRLAPVFGRKVLRAGRWRDIRDREVLAAEGRELGKLLYLSRGAAEVTHEGWQLGHLGPGDFIGEVTILHGGPATATVVASGPGRVFEIDRAKILDLLNTEHEIALHLSHAFSLEATRKLVSANQGAGNTGLVPVPEQQF